MHALFPVIIRFFNFFIFDKKVRIFKMQVLLLPLRIHHFDCQTQEYIFLILAIFFNHS